MLPCLLIIRNAFIEVEIGLNHILQFIRDHVVECQPSVLLCIALDADLQHLVLPKLLFQFCDEYLIFFAEVGAEFIVELFDYLRKRLQFLLWDEVDSQIGRASCRERV